MRRRAFADPRLAWTPRPLLLALAYAGLSGAAIVVGFGAGSSWRLTLVAAAACVLVALGQVARIRLALARRRRTADRLLRTGVRVHPRSELLTWRAAELTSDRNRRMFARSLGGIVREVEHPSPVTAVPLNRRGLRQNLPLIRSLVDRLVSVEHPVTAQGMLLVEELLTDGFSSPLYYGGRREDVAGTIERCLAVLDGAGSTERSVARPGSGWGELTRRPGPGTRVHSGGGLR